MGVVSSYAPGGNAVAVTAGSRFPGAVPSHTAGHPGIEAYISWNDFEPDDEYVPEVQEVDDIGAVFLAETEAAKEPVKRGPGRPKKVS
jgi:hypothetical protein